MELVILIGLQGAGKSSFYRAYFAATHQWISKDHLRNNRKPARRQRQLLEEALAAGQSVVIDNTNAARQDRMDLIALGRQQGARILGYFFESRLADCLERNQRRVGRERVPDVALYVTRKRLEEPTLEEEFDQLFFVRLLGEGQFAVEDWKERWIDDAT